jgi:mono/diheme cytochrome c family protein
MKAKVPQGRGRSARPSAWQSVKLSVKQLTRKSDQRWSAGGSAPHPGSADEREIIVSRVRRFSPWVLGLLAAAPLAPALGQNLDAGKSGSQIFSEVCSNCHRSPRELRNTSASFLREHYTTGSDMASTMANYLTGAGGGAGAPQPKRPPNPTAAAATAQEPASREPRKPPQADPKASPIAPALARGRPGAVQNTAEVKPPAAPPPAQPTTPPRPVLEEFEE